MTDKSVRGQNGTCVNVPAPEEIEAIRERRKRMDVALNNGVHEALTWNTYRPLIAADLLPMVDTLLRAVSMLTRERDEARGQRDCMTGELKASARALALAGKSMQEQDKELSSLRAMRERLLDLSLVESIAVNDYRLAVLGEEG